MKSTNQKLYPNSNSQVKGLAIEYVDSIGVLLNIFLKCIDTIKCSNHIE